MNTKSERKFSVVAAIILIVLSITCVLPILLLIMSSITSENSLIVNGYSLFPKEFGFGAYEYLWFSRAKILRAYLMTMLATAIGTVLSVTVTTLFAYPLSKKNLPGRSFLAFFIFFVMLFQGGMLPSYLVWTQIFHISDTFAALIFPNLLMNGFSVIMMRTYFASNIPDSIVEAAMLDGASELKILVSIAIPMAKPILTTVGLMNALAYWNDWMNGFYYLVRRTDLYTIQNLLNRLITSADFLNNNQTNSLLTSGIQIPSVGVRMAVAVIAVLPVLVIYPFFQKGFVKGIVIGGVKG